MPHAETLTPALPQGFSAGEIVAAARWVAAHAGPAAIGWRRVAATLKALQAIILRAQHSPPVCICDLLPGSGLEVLHIPSHHPRRGELVALAGEIDQAALRDIGAALRAEFVASNSNMLRLFVGGGQELIVYAAEVRPIVMAAASIDLV